MANLFDNIEDITKNFEGEDEDAVFEGPFDPTKIDVDISVYNLGTLLEQLEYEEIDLTPDFQRSSDLWTDVAKSRLIESILMGLPIPSFYFSEDEETPKLIIVDGLQRLCSLKDFWVTKRRKLKGLQFLTSLNGKGVDELDRTQIRRLKGLKITVNKLRKGTPPEVKLAIFQRVNTAGIPLNYQEMRNALYPKKATGLLKKMASLESFRQATGGKVSNRRMADADFANRFIAFYLRQEDYDGHLDKFMGDALEELAKLSPEKIDDILRAFDNSMKLCFSLMGENSFKRPDPVYTGIYLNKLNKSLFDVISVSFAHLTDTQQKALLERESEFNSKLDRLFTDYEFIRSITEGTAKKPQVKTRYDEFNKMIKEILNHD